jgi:murein DD-endopeptidase MepM/ murein hydrolase activator NlpD
MHLFSTLLLAVALLCADAPDADVEDRPRGEWPLRPAPEVVERFDPPDSAYGPGHRGVDLLGQVGQQVRAALDGSVTYAGMLAGRGVVVVDHGATRTTYEPLAATVAVGVPVAAGSPIGTLELTRSHCFPRACLHWGWIEGETYLDPLLLVGAGPVRLLPLWAAESLPTRVTYALPYVGVVARLTTLGRAALVGGDAITSGPP